MPVQTSPPPIPDSFPSFMSVFGGISPSFPDKEEENGVHTRLGTSPNVSANPSKHLLPFQHRESVSSMGSTESSPTTTISTFDSRSAADTSPSSSPESPMSMPLSYPKFMPPARNIESQSFAAAQYNATRRASDVPLQKRPDSPGRRDRNLKNLSLRMPPPSQSRPPIATASVVETKSQHHFSAPPSPINIPPKSSRRKPANLTIRTPAFDKSFSTSITEVAPPTPHGQHSLRHAESSRSLSLFSPSFGPKGGMQLPRPMTHHGARRLSGAMDDAPLPTVADGCKIAGDVLHELDEDDHPDSRESTRRNDRGYPNGPIQIYESGVFLYLEPTVQEASDFDVVVNVAQEVANPFTNTNLKNDTVMSAWRNASANAKRLSVAEPQTAGSEVSFKSALEYPQSETPSASKGDQSGPEYIHVGWDHNSEILDDLYPLCELIDSRVSQGKKVLIHCQLGVSRSASLVIAYGLYKHRDKDFNSVYSIVKERSQWVGPNMSLIYQLTDFRSRLLRGSPSQPAREEWFVRGPRRSSEPQPPRVITPGQECGGTGAGSKIAVQASASSISVPSTNPSAPSSAESTGAPKSLAHKRSLSPRPLHLGHSFHSVEPKCRYMKSESNLRRQDVPRSSTATELFARNNVEEPGLFSPRTSTFLSPSPAALELPAESRSSLSFGSLMADPRSPPPGNERVIMRNIDEFL